ncbi:MAG: 4Fe-4S binding protein [Anaerolineales bacterium]
MAIEQKSVVVFLNEDLCDGCRMCLPVCSYGALLTIPGERKPYVDHWSCTGCGTCVTTCPLQAMQLSKRRED